VLNPITVFTSIFTLTTQHLRVQAMQMNAGNASAVVVVVACNQRLS
jgi:hypothetical protein